MNVVSLEERRKRVTDSAPDLSLVGLDAPVLPLNDVNIARSFVRAKAQLQDFGNFEVEKFTAAWKGGSYRVFAVNRYHSQTLLESLHKKVQEESFARIVVQQLERNAPEISFLREVADQKGIAFTEIPGFPFHASTTDLADLGAGEGLRALVVRSLVDLGLDPRRLAAMLSVGFNIDELDADQFVVEPTFDHAIPESTLDRYKLIWEELKFVSARQISLGLGGSVQQPGHTLYLVHLENLDHFQTVASYQLDKIDCSPRVLRLLRGELPAYCRTENGEFLSPSQAYRLLCDIPYVSEILELAEKHKNDPTDVVRAAKLYKTFVGLMEEARLNGFQDLAQDWAKLMWDNKVRDGRRFFGDLLRDQYVMMAESGDWDGAVRVARRLARHGFNRGASLSYEAELSRDYFDAMANNENLDRAVNLARILGDLSPELYRHHLEHALEVRVERALQTRNFASINRDRAELKELRYRGVWGSPKPTESPS